MRVGATFCRRHDPIGPDVVTGSGWRRVLPGTRSEAADDEEDAGERRRRAGALFRKRLAQGDYRALFERRLGEVIAQAAADRSLTDEIGALRFVLARLLAEEDDLTKLATSVARVAAVAIQGARAQRAISGEAAGDLTDAVTRILAELDG